MEFEQECFDRNCILRISESAWKSDVKDYLSIVPIYCKLCKNECKTTRDGNFMKGSLGCHCKNKGEKAVFKFLQGEGFQVSPGKVDWCVNDKTGFHLPFDMIIHPCKKC